MQIIKTPAVFSAKHPIVDVEISNNIEVHGWNYLKGEISLVGFFVDDKITQFMLTDKSKIEDMKKSIENFLSTIDRPMYAFNTKMESGCFQNFLGFSPDFNEIKPFNGKGASKEYFFGYLIKSNVILEDSIGFKDPLKGNSKLCMDCWSQKRFEDVRKHNLCCLTKEAKILEHNEFLKNEFSNLINDDDWLKSDAVLPLL